MRAKVAHGAHERRESPGITERVRRPTKSVDSREREVRGAQRHEVAFVWTDLAGEQAMVEPVRIHAPDESCHLERGTANVHARDYPHDADSLVRRKAGVHAA
jgi:hypothetical protein